MAQELERGRRLYEERSWIKAHEALSEAEGADPLAADDLELLAVSAYMIGRDDDYLEALERAHQAHLSAGATERAVRCAFWSGLQWLVRGEPARANGWFGRAHRLLGDGPTETVEHGYLLIPGLLQQALVGDDRAAASTAARAAEIGRRFGDADLTALTAQEQGHALVRQGRTEEGMALIDEIMVAVTADALSPIVTGLVYCNTIAFCQGVYEVSRAREWTAALTRWCEDQPEMVAHTGVCLVHRAEIMELAGRWPEALDEAGRARERLARATPEGGTVGAAVYRQAELHRLRGELTEAEEAYRHASRCGWDPQPGLALLRLAQGRVDDAVNASAARLGETGDPLARVEPAPRSGRGRGRGGRRRGGRACSRGARSDLARHPETPVIEAIAARLAGATELAAEEPQRALASLRRGLEIWQSLEAPFEVARTRALMARACRALGDSDSARLELEAARSGFERLGAKPALAALDGGRAPGGRPRPHRPRARGPAFGRGGSHQSPDRGGTGDQRAHRRPSPAEHLRQARRLLANRRRRLRLRARARLTATSRGQK